MNQRFAFVVSNVSRGFRRCDDQFRLRRRRFACETQRDGSRLFLGFFPADFRRTDHRQRFVQIFGIFLRSFRRRRFRFVDLFARRTFTRIGTTNGRFPSRIFVVLVFFVVLFVTFRLQNVQIFLRFEKDFLFLADAILLANRRTYEIQTGRHSFFDRFFLLFEMFASIRRHFA